MKIFIDGFGVVAHSIVRKLIEKHSLPTSSLFVNTYDSQENLLFRKYLDQVGIPYVIGNYDDLYEEINQFNPDYFFSLYGRRIIPKGILQIVKKKSINLHPSLLPEYKGCFSCPWVILNYEKFTGITIHEIVDKVDSGDILFQKKITLQGDETAFSLYHKLVGLFVSNFDEFFYSLVSQKIIPIKMSVGGKYYSRKVPYSGYIDINWSIKKVEAFIRAMDFPPHKGAILKQAKMESEINSIQEFLRLTQ